MWGGSPQTSESHWTLGASPQASEPHALSVLMVLSHGPRPHVFTPENEAVCRGAETCLRPQPTAAVWGQTLVCGPAVLSCPGLSGPFLSLWVGRACRGQLGSRSRPPLPPTPASSRSGLRALGLGFAELSLAPSRGLGGESAEQHFPPQSRTVLSKSSKDRVHFFQMIQQHVNGKGRAQGFRT